MNWTVDYGQGPHDVTLPHVFWDDRLDIRWEGPATYRTSLAPHNGEWLVFEGVSYEAVISIDGEHVLTHRGIWDAFSIDLSPWSGLEVDVEVVVTKNGGETFPVKDVLSGFLPYVDSTFGGLYRPVRVVSSATDPLGPKPKPKQRIGVQGTKLWLDGRPWYMRGVLTWGWYPDYRHPAPPLSVFEDDWKRVKELGFNTVKFCLWLPPHEAIEALKKRDLVAWVELPLWMPTGDEQRLAEMEEEIKRIVLQYRHHDNIVCWTVGCELSESTPPEFRQRLTGFVLAETGCPLVKDNSGGAEMYGGDPREYGTFDDFHPYCDLMYYPQVLQSLAHGPREKRPILLGEFNDFDHVRDLDALAREMPYWASNDPALNDQGVRWQYDFPPMLEKGEGPLWKRSGADWKEKKWRYQRESAAKADYIRSTVFEAVAAIDDIAGWVITGWADTPISTSGVVGKRKKIGSGPESWIRGTQIFRIPRRTPPWVNGGNRPGWQSANCFFAGLVQLSLGIRTDDSVERTVEIHIDSVSAGLKRVFSSRIELRTLALTPQHLTRIDLELPKGAYIVVCQTNSPDARIWARFFHVVEPLTAEDLRGYCYRDRADDQLSGLSWDSDGFLVSACDEDLAAISVGLQNGAEPAPFWRECIQVGDDPLDYTLLHDVASDYVLPPDDEVLLRRIDTRTYKEGSYITRRPNGQIVTTLRPWGGLGVQPPNIKHNPAGHWLIRELIRLHKAARP